MDVRYLFLLSALVVSNGKCDCDKYINCFGDFLRDFFGNINFGENVNGTDVNETTIIDASNAEDIDQVISDITSLIKEIDINIKEENVIESQNNKTKIVVKTFELDNDFKTELPEETFTSTTQSTTMEIENFDLDVNENSALSDVDNIILSEYTTPSNEATTLNSLSVIPLKSDKENEIIADSDSYNDLDEDNITDYLNIDYIDLYKDTTNEYVEYIPITTELNNLRAEIDKQENDIENIIENSSYMLNEDALTNIIKNVTAHNTAEDQQLISKVFPWVAAIFVKNESGASQFNYFCDGALLSDRVILTAARCVRDGNETYKEENFIVILGKKSLQTSGEEEKILRVKKVTTHENFTLENLNAANDLAFLTLEEAVIFTDAISPAVLENDETNNVDGKSNDGIATAWNFLGDLTLIYFDKEKSKACRTDNKVENTFCATYGNEVPLCPSYGGIYVSKREDNLYLHGIRTGDPLDRGVCFSKQVTYTTLQNYTCWLNNILQNKDA